MFVPHGEEVTAVDTLENRHREAMEVAAVDITYLRIGGEAEPECTGASRAGVQAKVENPLVGKRIGPPGDLGFDVIYEGRGEPHSDCVGEVMASATSAVTSERKKAPPGGSREGPFSSLRTDVPAIMRCVRGGT